MIIDLWIKTWKILIFTHCLPGIVTSQSWSLLKWKCDFLVPWNISNQIHWILCPKWLYFLRKYTKSSKIRSRGAVPLKGWFARITLLLRSYTQMVISQTVGGVWTWFWYKVKAKRVLLTMISKTHFIKKYHLKPVLWSASQLLCITIFILIAARRPCPFKCPHIIYWNYIP